MKGFAERAAVIAAFWWVAFGVMHGDWLGYWNPAVAIPLGLITAYLEFTWGRLIPKRFKRHS
jgi:hypothetical protein